jgi:hypothetical protein
VTLLLQIFHFFANHSDNNEPSFFDGITMVDPQKVVGNPIRAKANHVTSDAECKRRYGANWNTKMLYGVVVDVENIVNPTTNTRKTMITGTYNLSGGIEKTKKLLLINIQVVLTGDVDYSLIETTPLETGPR